MTGVNEIRAMYSGVTTAAADVMHLDHFGIEPSRDADLVVLQTRNPVEAIRLRATRLYVLRRGNVIAESQPQNVKLALGETKVDVDFLANTVRGD